MVVIVALVGSLGVLNTLTLNVLQGLHEIGVMRAIGATGVSLVRSFLIEAVAFGGMGWLLGLALCYE